MTQQLWVHCCLFEPYHDCLIYQSKSYLFHLNISKQGWAISPWLFFLSLEVWRRKCDPKDLGKLNDIRSWTSCYSNDESQKLDGVIVYSVHVGNICDQARGRSPDHTLPGEFALRWTGDLVAAPILRARLAGAPMGGAIQNALVSHQSLANWGGSIKNVLGDSPTICVNLGWRAMKGRSARGNGISGCRVCKGSNHEGWGRGL